MQQRDGQTMKKIILISLFILGVLLAACSNQTVNQQTEDGNAADSQTNEKAASNEQKKDNENKDKQDKNDKRGEEKKKAETLEPKYKVSDVFSIVPIDQNTNEKVVLLTFDDAPDEHALEMAKTLKSLDAGAIFFVNGHFLESPEKKEMLKEIHDMGFMIGNHTYSHAYLPDLPEQEQRAEIVRVSDMVEKITGEKPEFFRAPNGANTDYTKKIAEEQGMILMNWSYGYDWNKEYMSKEALTDIMLNTDLLANGVNLLMHDREWTAAALKDIVTGLRDKGYEMVDPKLIKTR